MKGEEIVCTPGHPFYILNADDSRYNILYEGTKTDVKGKWISAKYLKTCDKVLLSDGSCAIIEKIEIEQLENIQPTYNFEVEDFHTYYVSQNSVLVHNFCPKENADYYVKYKAEGEEFKAYHQAKGKYKDLYIAKDSYKHGQSNYKLLKKVSGNKLELIGDLDVNGHFMLGKHSSNLGQKYLFFGRKYL